MSAASIQIPSPIRYAVWPERSGKWSVRDKQDHHEIVSEHNSRSKAQAHARALNNDNGTKET